MSYMLLMVEDPEQQEQRTDDEGREVYDRMLRFGEDLQKRGLLVASESLAADYRRTQFGGWPWADAGPVHGPEPRRFAKHGDARGGPVTERD